MVGTATGVACGFVMSRSRFAEWLIDPFVALGFPAPKIAFLPIFILSFGIGSSSKILLVAFACIFPVVIGTYNAARSVSRLFLYGQRCHLEAIGAAFFFMSFCRPAIRAFLRPFGSLCQWL